MIITLITCAAGSISGCSATGALSALGQVPTVAAQVDNIVPELILAKYQALHNMKVGMEAIDASKGTVTMVTPGPQVVPQ